MPAISFKTQHERLMDAQENMQEIVLVALSKAGFFNEAAFYGGTCLRLVHGLDRFSEDMDFSLLKKDEKFTLEKYFPAIINEFQMRGKNVEIKKKDKQSFGKVQSAFLKDNTDTYDLKFQTEKTPKIKIETDYLPPLKFQTENVIISKNDPSVIRAFSLPCLYAGKMHALLFRKWETRIKGRDWYDFEWYVKRWTPMDFTHFNERCKEFSGTTFTPDSFLSYLRERIKSTNIETAKQDVLPFIKNPEKIEHWSSSYFLALADKIQIEEKTALDETKRKEIKKKLSAIPSPSKGIKF